jgi:integrase
MTKPHPKASQSVFAYAGDGLLRLVSSGVYYARFKHAGKQYKKCLGTSDKAHARRLLHDYRIEVQNITSKEAARITFETIAARWLGSIRHMVKPSTLKRRETCIANLVPYFRRETLSGVTVAQCEAWKNGRGDKIAPQTFAHELGTMKAVFEYAIAQGILYRNPAKSIKRKRIVSLREKHIPTRAQFPKLIAAIRKSDGRPESQAAAKNGADFVELLAYSGMRKAEAATLTWQDVDFEKNFLNVTGGANRTKNYETRQVPLSGELRELLLRLHGSAKPTPTDNVARIADPKKCLHTACGKLGFPYFSPHRFRDFFATTCIEYGTDIPTVARWLGHKDGGALLMKTYAHLRQEHSQEQMKRISFGIRPANLDTDGKVISLAELKRVKAASVARRR